MKTVSPDDSSVSLEVTPEQANQVVLAKQLGKLTLVLRGQNEDPKSNSARKFSDAESHLTRHNSGIA
ncbi:RcpC/CpaB family pilus assembly protein [Vibrio chagasii]|nr:RcpC/CpaB family pilus assembly protein [Vibrio chagasii]